MNRNYNYQFFILVVVSFLGIFAQLGCTSSEKNHVALLKVNLVEQLQIELYAEFEQSMQIESKIHATKLDPTNKPLGEIAYRQLEISAEFDASLSEIIIKIDRLIKNLIVKNSNLTKSNESTLIFDNSIDIVKKPVVFDFDKIVFTSIDIYPKSYIGTINSINTSIENLRIIFVKSQFGFYELNSLKNVNIANSRNFKTYRDEFLSKKNAIRKSNALLCNAGEYSRIEHINLLLSLNENKWNESFKNNSDVLGTICNLVLLQKKLFNCRNQLFNLFDVHLYCERLKMKNKKNT